jgi:single-strand DNA-binding protein
MSDIVTLTGIVATTPRHLITSSQVAITSFRLASGQRRFDRAKNAWVDATTNWYTVSTFRQLAFNVAASVHKGEHVIVTGRLRIRDWDNQDRNGTSVDVEADSVGHDLFWCTSTAVRKAARSSQPVEPPEFPESAGIANGDLSPTELVGISNPS